MTAKRSVQRRMQAAIEAFLPGLPSENLGLLARELSVLAQEVLLRHAPTLTLTSQEQAELSQAVDASATRFLSHLSRRSTAEHWESFAVPWDYATTLARVQSGQYTAALLEDAGWVLERTVAMFSSNPPRSASQARKAARTQVPGRDSVRLSDRLP